MTYEIGDVTITNIDEVSITDSREHLERRMKSRGSNQVLVGSKNLRELEISITLVEKLHPEGKTVEEQRMEIKSLSRNEDTFNTFSYERMDGFLSIGSVDIPEGSSEDTIRNGTINADFLPKPKHIDNESPTVGNFTVE